MNIITTVVTLSKEEENKELALSEIEQRYPNQWVLVEETAWDEQGNPTQGLVQARSMNRDDLHQSLQELKKRRKAKTFIFYTGDKIPEDLTVLL